jgi:hypothetical protein
MKIWGLQYRGQLKYTFLLWINIVKEPEEAVSFIVIWPNELSKGRRRQSSRNIFHSEGLHLRGN